MVAWGTKQTTFPISFLSLNYVQYKSVPQQAILLLGKYIELLELKACVLAKPGTHMSVHSQSQKIKKLKCQSTDKWVGGGVLMPEFKRKKKARHSGKCI